MKHSKGRILMTKKLKWCIFKHKDENASLSIDILSYLLDKHQQTNVMDILNKFLDEKQGLLVTNSISECRGSGSFLRLSAILFVIIKLQRENQIMLAHIDQALPKYNEKGNNQPIRIGHPDGGANDGKITGYYQKFLNDHLYSIIYVSDEAHEYIKRGGLSSEIFEAQRQTILSICVLLVAVITMLISIVSMFSNC